MLTWLTLVLEIIPTPKKRSFVVSKSGLFERIGGDAVVEAAVNRFYEKFLACDDINRFFAGIDMRLQQEKLRTFFTLILGGFEDYPLERLTLIHAPLIKRGLNRSHVELWIELMQQTLLELQVPKEIVDILMDRVDRYKQAIGAS
jgi:hemoglobin